MKRFHAAAIVAATLAAALPAAPATAAKPAEIAVTPQSADAAIILKAPMLGVAPGLKTAYRLYLHTYDPHEQKMVGGAFGGGAVFEAKPKNFADGYLVVAVKPGTYAFQSFYQQDYWGLCFNGGSLAFTVKPGEVLYLGAFDALKYAAELQGLAISNHQTSTRGQAVEYFDTVTPPALSAVDDADLAAVAAMMRSRMPNTTVAPRAALLSPARFGTGRDLFGLSRICGGYYQGKAKAKP
jgi:hypothetical protein